MLKVIDRWTTIDGEWYVVNKPYSITQEALERWGSEEIPGKGGSTHIFVKVPVDAFEVEFNTPDFRNSTRFSVRGGSWVNFPMFHSSSYDPTKGIGPWHVRIDGELVADGIGLPNSWHVSTFLVVEDVEPSVVLPDPPTQVRDKIQLIVNGVTVYSN